MKRKTKTQTNAVVFYSFSVFVSLRPKQPQPSESNKTYKLDPNTDFLFVANQYNNTKGHDMGIADGVSRFPFFLFYFSLLSFSLFTFSATFFGQNQLPAARASKFATIRNTHIIS